MQRAKIAANTKTDFILFSFRDEAIGDFAAVKVVGSGGEKNTTYVLKWAGLIVHLINFRPPSDQQIHSPCESQDTDDHPEDRQ